MTLSDRLQQARTRRLIESGVLSSEYALKPEADIAPKVDDNNHDAADVSADGLFAPITIEVQSTGLHLVPSPPTDLTDVPEGERSATCPNCNTVGHLDMVDLVGHTMHLTCETCGTMWQVRHDADHPTPH